MPIRLLKRPVRKKKSGKNKQKTIKRAAALLITIYAISVVQTRDHQEGHYL